MVFLGWFRFGFDSSIVRWFGFGSCEGFPSAGSLPLLVPSTGLVPSGDLCSGVLVWLGSGSGLRHLVPFLVLGWESLLDLVDGVGCVAYWVVTILRGFDLSGLG